MGAVRVAAIAKMVLGITLYGSIGAGGGYVIGEFFPLDSFASTMCEPFSICRDRLAENYATILGLAGVVVGIIRGR